MIAAAFARASLHRLLRDRTALFFVVVLPVLVILLIGLTVRNTDRIRVGIVVRDSGVLTRDLANRLETSPALQTRRLHDLDAARTAVRREEVAAVVVIPPAFDAILRRGGRVTVTLLSSGHSEAALAVRAAVGSVVSGQAAQVQAAVFATAHSSVDFPQALSRAESLQTQASTLGVRTDIVDSGSDRLPAGFSYSAPTMLVLFVFINAITGASGVIQARKLGVYSRALAAPVSAREIVVGEMLTMAALALLQSGLIVGVGAFVFGVDWGDPPAAALLVCLWAMVGTGVGLLGGTLFRTAEQAAAIGPAVGIGLGMLGGCMWPLEIVSPVMRTIGHLTPHAWAVDAWSTLLSRGGTTADIGSNLLVLAVVAAGALALASVRLRRLLVPT